MGPKPIRIPESGFAALIPPSPVIHLDPTMLYTRMSNTNPLVVRGINLTFDGGGPYVPPQSVFIFLPKISPPDQTLRPKINTSKIKSFE